MADADGVQSRYRCRPAQFDDLQFSHHGIAFHRLREPEETIGDSEDRIVAYLRRVILADQKRRGFPTGEKLGETLDERLHLQFGRAVPLCAAHQGAKRIHHHEARMGRRDLFDDFIEDRV